MRQWLANNLQTLVYLLAFLIPAVMKGLAVLAEKKREAEAQRARGGSDGRAPSERPTLRRAEVSAQNQPPETIQQELASQRQAQIEMWKAREAALRGQRQAPTVPAPVSAEDALAQRRRAAMEELRRRQVESDRLRSPQPVEARRPKPAPSPTPPERQPARSDAERRRRATQRIASAGQDPRAGRVVQDVVASLGTIGPAAEAQSQPRIVPGSRTTPVGTIVFTRESLRKAIIMKELLDPPLALRDNPAGSSSGYHLPF